MSSFLHLAFDDLKNTLAFMEDSPLVSASNNTHTPRRHNNNNTSHHQQQHHHNHHSAAPPPNQVLMVKLETHAAQSDGSTSLSSSSSSSSGLSSSGSSSCYLPKSNSNPMLILGGSISSASTSPTSVSSSSRKSCTCAKTASNSSLHQHAQQTSALDVLMKKSSSDLEQQHQVHSSYAGNSLIAPAHSLNLNSNTLLTSLQQQSTAGSVGANGGINVAIESAAKKYRCAAQISEASCCWKGKLPPKQYKTPIVYSTKVFVGGLPWDITEEDLVKEFGGFGPCRVEWTNKEKFNLLNNNNRLVVSYLFKKGLEFSLKFFTNVLLKNKILRFFDILQMVKNIVMNTDIVKLKLLTASTYC